MKSKFPLDNDTPCTRPGTNPIMCQCCGQIQQQTTAPAGPPALVQPHGQPSPQWFTTHQPPQYGQPGLPHQPGPQLHPFIMQPAAHTPLGPRLCPRAAQLGMRCHLFYAFCSFAVLYTLTWLRLFENILGHRFYGEFCAKVTWFKGFLLIFWNGGARGLRS